MANKRISLLGVEVDAITMNEAARQIIELSRANRASYVVKPYVEFIERAAMQNEIKVILNNAALILPDGVALAWAARYLYQPKHSIYAWLKSLFEIVLDHKATFSVLPERFGGTDFTIKILEAAARNKSRIFLVGSPKSQTIEQTAETMRKLYPDIEIVGTAPGIIPDQRSEDELRTKIIAAKADIILIGMGFPRQELLMSRLVAQLPHGVMIGEGGSFDFDILGGKLHKAPAWVGRLGLEWFWRLILEPSRIGRQLSIPRFMIRVYRAGQSIKANPPA